MLGYGLMYGLKALVFALVLVALIVGQSRTKEEHYGSSDNAKGNQ